MTTKSPKSPKSHPNRKVRRASVSKRKGGAGKALAMPKRMTLKRARKKLTGMRDDALAFVEGKEAAIEELAQKFLADGEVGGRPCTTIELARECATILFTPAEELGNAGQ